jgi:YHS domain-containing protein
MRVDRGKAIHKDVAGERHYFCSERCLHAFEVDSHAREAKPSHEEEATYAREQ